MTFDVDKMAKEFQEEPDTSYSEAVIDHAQNPRNVGVMDNPDGYAMVTGSCEDTMEIWLKIKAKQILRATFWTDGCHTTIACGSQVTVLATGKTIGEALGIGPDVIINNLGGLPKDNIHCAGLAATTLKKALIDFLSFQNDPWKRAYKKP